MAYCPNIDCPHRKRTGKPAEFMEGVTHCSDCGAELVDTPQEDSSLPQEESGLSEMTKRILFTLGMIVLWRLIFMIPVPGIDFDALNSFANTRGMISIFGLGSSFKIGFLGIGPYIAAYVILELSALFVPNFKDWRADGPAGRAKLRKWALMMTFFIAFVYGYAGAVGIEELSDGAFVSYPGIKFRLMVSLTMTAVVFLFVWTTDLVTRKGIGHGISILILSGILPRFFTQALGQMRKLFLDVEVVRSGFHPPFNSIFTTILFSICFLVVLFALIVFVERSHKKIPVLLEDGGRAYLPLKLTAAGITSASFFVPTILTIPVIIFRFPGTEPFPPFVNALASAGQPISSFIALWSFYSIFSLLHSLIIQGNCQPL